MTTGVGPVRIMTWMVETQVDEDSLRHRQAPEEGEDEPTLRQSRVARLRASHSYGLVMLLVLGTLAFTGLAPDGDWAKCTITLLLGTLLVAALWTSGVVRLRSYPIVILLLIAAASALAQLVSADRLVRGGLSLVDASLAAAAIVVIGLGAVDQGEVNRQSLRAAISVYLLLGMFFVFVYGAVAAFGSGEFFAQGTDGTTAQRFYFSFVTLATLGYGDYTAAGNFGHLLAVSEALLGQLYLVTVLALLVGALGRKRREELGE